MIPFLTALMLQAAVSGETSQARSHRGRLPNCTVRNAEPASVEAITADPSDYHEQCVSVSALTDGKTLFATMRAYRRGWGENESLPIDSRRSMNRITDAGSRRITAIGRILHCGELRAIATANAAPGSIVMMMGVCHSTDGPALFLSEVRDAPRSRLPVN